MKTITVEIKNTYGIKLVYPVCEDAKRLAELAGTRTLTDGALRIIQALGYGVDIKPQTLFRDS